ncbi:MAG TPA: malto-oligosyltrehalose synthase [Bradyrhizobium sp.]|nr:malto-oligosyltrehalose synthase [Bradyrhizobium sp.]
MAVTLPLSTYRLQLSSEFGFDDAAKLVPYLKTLGITHVYSSPFLKARKGSTHGYDIVDHGALNPEFGGEEAFVRLSDALREAGLGLILDFVPNHMGIGYADNSWWLDVLEWGQQSPHSRAFDIAWELLPYRRGGGVLLPVLGRPYGEALHSGEIALKYDSGGGTFSAWYFDHRFPISPQRYGEILKSVVAAAGATSEPAGRALAELASAHSHPRAPSYAQAASYKQRLAAIESGAELIERGLVAYDAATEDGRQALHRLLERQHYRLAYWRVSVSGINYRRFFDINDLAGLRVEEAPVFQAVHVLVARLIREDRLQGLRLDHIDGLRDPFQYTRRLGHLIRSIRKEDAASFHVTVEKILGDDERPPRFPGMHGTTGYEWLNLISRLLLDERSLPILEKTWCEFSGERRPLPEILLEAKQRVIDTILTSEFTVLTQLLARIAAGHYSTRDYTADRLRAALECYVLAFPVYRTYVTGAGASEADRTTIESTIAAARAHWPGPDPEIFEFLRNVITLDLPGNSRSYSRSRIRNFAYRLQQFTGPLMAKSLEDTAFYRYHRLIALNEVGNDPSNGGISATAFHERMSARAREAPLGLTATATHDTKRGEDARMRILALAEITEDWTAATAQWRDMARTVRASENIPTAAHEYMLYQALVGAWPFTTIDRAFVGRMQAYAVKAAREGKQQTSWVNTNESYEQVLTQFVADILDPEKSGQLVKAFEAFMGRPVLLGALNSLSQLVLKATMPGVPDFYQGTEFWDLSLVDPDNRRPVDFSARKTALGENAIEWSTLHETWRDGHVKLALMQRLLALRNRLPQLFLNGAYQGLEVKGRDADHVVAFARTHGRDRVVVAVGRHFAALTEHGRCWPRNWQGHIHLQTQGFTDAIGSVDDPVTPDLNVLFAYLPVAVISTTSHGHSGG